VLDACVEEAKKAYEKGARTFKIEARRIDKSFPLGSYQLCCAAGDAVVEALPSFRVDVKNPHLTISVEVRERAYIYGEEQAGCRGLPVGTAGRGMLLLSGGIDSPVAGYMMATRGMGIDAVHFHTYPYTSNEALQKVLTLANLVSKNALSMRVYVVSFTEVQARIKEASPPAWSTIMLRMAMMQCAAAIAREAKCKCLITGESLAQVASQTVENISCTESVVHAPFRSGKIHSYPLPVLRPLIGIDKEAIITSARKIGTYETSILPYEDCCVLFSPEHPILRGSLLEAEPLYRSLELGPLIEKCVMEKTVEKFPE
jgi:thiamine biosynthesis protein ThiI